MSEQTDPFDFSPELESALKEKYKGKASEAEWKIFLDLCKRRKLIPGTQVHLTTRVAKEYNEDLHTSVFVNKSTLITSIDAFRLIAQRTGDYAGQRQPVYVYLEKNTFDEFAPTLTSKYPLPGKQLYGVEVSVLRKTFQEPLTAFARFEAYVSTYRKNNVEQVSPMWERRGPEQCAKCAEALALRQAFPEDLSGLYTDDEMAHVQDEVENKEVASTSILVPQMAVPATEAFPVSAAQATDHGSRPQSEQDFNKGASNMPTPPISAPQSDSTVAPAPNDDPKFDFAGAGASQLAEESTTSTIPTPDQYKAYCDRVKELKAKLEDANLGFKTQPLPIGATGSQLRRYFAKKLNTPDEQKISVKFTIEQWMVVLGSLEGKPLQEQIDLIAAANQKEEK